MRKAKRMKKVALNPNLVYPISVAATILGRSRRTLLRWAQIGIIHFETSVVNGRKVFRGSELQRILRNEHLQDPFIEKLKNDMLL